LLFENYGQEVEGTNTLLVPNLKVGASQSAPVPTVVAPMQTGVEVTRVCVRCDVWTDWSEDEATNSSDENSEDEVDRPARAAADGMSSDAESECLL